MSGDFELVFFDEFIAVVIKPAGVLTVPSHGEEGLVDLLERELDKRMFGRHRPFTIHRLDRQTSGVLAFARDPKSASKLGSQFASHSVEREYVAIVRGKVEQGRGTIRQKLRGKNAVTHFEVLSQQESCTAVKLRLETGRRHQIRQHLAGLGHPILGDALYDESAASNPIWPFTRLALHARTLGFLHPMTRAWVSFEAPLPKEFEGLYT